MKIIICLVICFLCYVHVEIAKKLSGVSAEILTLSNKVEKYVCIRFVCLSVCARSNSRKYSSNVLKLMYVIQVYCRMFCIKNGEHRSNGSRIDTHKKPFEYITAVERLLYGQRAKNFKSAF